MPSSTYILVLYFLFGYWSLECWWNYRMVSFFGSGSSSIPPTPSVSPCSVHTNTHREHILFGDESSMTCIMFFLKMIYRSLNVRYLECDFVRTLGLSRGNWIKMRPLSWVSAWCGWYLHKKERIWYRDNMPGGGERCEGTRGENSQIQAEESWLDHTHFSGPTEGCTLNSGTVGQDVSSGIPCGL